MKNVYEVIVGNIGTIHVGHNRREAVKWYRFYVKDSMTGLGRSGNEAVTLFANGEPILEHSPPGRENDE